MTPEDHEFLIKEKARSKMGNLEDEYRIILNELSLGHVSGEVERKSPNDQRRMVHERHSNRSQA